MIGYVTVGTNDMERGAAYYDALFGSIGAGRLMDEERFIVWGVSMNATGFSIIKPYDEKPATVGNGVMVAIAMDSPEKVDAFYKKAIELGGTDEGEPGPRGDSGFYAGYFRDLDGNKLNAFCMTSK